jgi:hypothetical protein
MISGPVLTGKSWTTIFVRARVAQEIPVALAKRNPEEDRGTTLSTPWGGKNNVGRRGVSASLANCTTDTASETFITERTRVHELFIREQAKTKRLSLLLASTLLLAAVAAVLFAPAGREVVSYWLGAALFVFSAGAAGYGKVSAKVKGMSAEAGDREPW